MTISEILTYLEAEGIPFSFSGDPQAQVDGFSSLPRYRAGSFTWIKKQESIPAGMDLTGVQLDVAMNAIVGALLTQGYVDELANFFAVLKGAEQPRYSFEKDLETIRLIEAIEEA